jgi:calcineurin-like phosphoesterase
MDKDGVMARFVTGLPGRFETATGDPRLNAVAIDVDPATGRATAIARVSHSEEELKVFTDHAIAARA